MKNSNKFNIQFYDPATLCEIGGKSNNEDAILINNESHFFKLFIVCDGLGGCPSGEYASKITCEMMNKYFESNRVEEYDHATFENALSFTKEKFGEFENSNPSSLGMKTTLTAAFSDRNGLNFLWIGDSRIYFVRNGKILFESKDHSVINDLIDKGELDPKDAKRHPHRNKITRVISSQSKHLPDSYETQDVQKNDFILLCSDGLLENLDATVISNLFLKGNSPQFVKEQISSLCKDNTKDNYSMILLKVKSIE